MPHDGSMGVPVSVPRRQVRKTLLIPNDRKGLVVRSGYDYRILDKIASLFVAEVETTDENSPTNKDGIEIAEDAFSEENPEYLLGVWFENRIHLTSYGAQNPGYVRNLLEIYLNTMQTHSPLESVCIFSHQTDVLSSLTWLKRQDYCGLYLEGADFYAVHDENDDALVVFVDLNCESG